MKIMEPFIYLDHAATTPLLPEVADAMVQAAREAYGNPFSQHAAGRRARQRLEDAREGLAQLLGADILSAAPDRLVFTSGGTEANNLALRGLAGSRPCRVLVSALEHSSVHQTAVALRRAGYDVQFIPAARRGTIDLDALQQLLQTPTRLVSVMLANNETGVLQPLGEVLQLCRAHDALLHTDAVQAVGKLPLDFHRLQVDALTLAAHKFHGPRGIGGLLLRHGVKLEPLLFGGPQEAGLRPGTECVALAVGMHEALRLWHAQADAHAQHMAALRDALQAALCDGWPEAVVHGAESPRVPQTLSIALPPLDRQALVVALDRVGVACSSGSACASGSSEHSPALRAMGCPEALLDSSIRLSVGISTSLAEVEEAASRILKVCKDLYPHFAC
jgi:cysteine desulfurase